MTEKILTVFGDEFFPKIGTGTSQKRRQLCANNVFGFLNSVKPDLVYIIPTAGTCVYVAMVCSLIKIPYILISPYPGFFDLLNNADKECMVRALDGAKSVIIINEEEQVDKAAAWEEALEFATGVSHAIAFLHSKNTSKEYLKFMNEYSEKYFEDKLLLELAYDSRKVFLE